VTVVKLTYKPYTRDVPSGLLAGIRAEYENGKSVRAIATMLGCSYGTTHRLLTRAGVTFRPRTRRPAGRNKGTPGAVNLTQLAKGGGQDS
jgi:transposase